MPKEKGKRSKSYFIGIQQVEQLSTFTYTCLVSLKLWSDNVN